MLQISEIRESGRFRIILPPNDEEYAAIEAIALADGIVYEPLLVWEEEHTLIYGYAALKILQAHPELEYTIKMKSFQDWQEAYGCAVERHLARPTLNLWQKLELAFTCEDYWIAKDLARQARGTRNDLRSAADRRLPQQVNKIIADKVGCGKTAVMQFKKLYDEAPPGIREKCRKGDLSIDTAYNCIVKKEKSKKGKSDTKKDGKATEAKIEITGTDILGNCADSTNTSRSKSTDGEEALIHIQGITEKLLQAKAQKGGILLVLYKGMGYIAVVRKILDDNLGVWNIEVNLFACGVHSDSDQVMILEASPIPGPPITLRSKDTAEFDEADPDRKVS